jgi:sugar transferase (PEP-CTERM/EpsH1 system associated)
MTAQTPDWASPPGAGPPIRVVHLVRSLEIGGLEKIVLDLVRCRTQDVFSTRILCLDTEGALAPRFTELGVPVDTVGGPGDALWRRVARLARTLRRVRPHVLHTHNPSPHLQGALAAWAAGVPVLVHTKHGRNYVDRPVSVMLNRFAASLSNCVVAVSEDAAQVARDIERVPAAKVRIVHNGVDVERFGYRKPRAADNSCRAVTVARLDPVKDQASLLRAVRLVVDKNPAFSLDVVGDGPSRPELESLRAALGLDGRVIFHGVQDDVEPFLADADFFVLSSLSEGIPLTLLEAMAVGLPAVATDVGGNREVVVSGETGYLVPAGSPGALADAMLKIQADMPQLQRMGLASRRRVEEHFNLRTVVAQYENVYLQCLGRSTPAPGRVG